MPQIITHNSNYNSKPFKHHDKKYDVYCASCTFGNERYHTYTSWLIPAVVHVWCKSVEAIMNFSLKYYSIKVCIGNYMYLHIYIHWKIIYYIISKRLKRIFWTRIYEYIFNMYHICVYSTIMGYPKFIYLLRHYDYILICDEKSGFLSNIQHRSHP